MNKKWKLFFSSIIIILIGIIIFLVYSNNKRYQNTEQKILKSNTDQITMYDDKIIVGSELFNSDWITLSDGDLYLGIRKSVDIEDKQIIKELKQCFEEPIFQIVPYSEFAVKGYPNLGISFHTGFVFYMFDTIPGHGFIEFFGGEDKIEYIQITIPEKLNTLVSETYNKKMSEYSSSSTE